jgi:hypothetical protein
MEQSSNLTPIRFQFFSLKFTPFSGTSHDHNSILKDVITYITVKRSEGQGHLIDKNRNRPQEERRELFMTSAVIMYRERRIRCSIALLRPGRIPKLKPKDEFKLVPLANLGTVAEETHFYIDFSRNKSILCVEYNHHGPRISDIEYYLRNVSNQTLRLSKATEVEVFIDASIDEALTNLKKVLNLEVKIQPGSLAQMDTSLVGKYFTGLSNLGNLVRPKFFKLEALFQTPGKGIESAAINGPANTMVKDFLNAFKARPFNIDCFDNFVVKYEDIEGKEEVFNLLKGKKELIKEVDLKTITTKRLWYEVIEKDFDEFMQNLPE